MKNVKAAKIIAGIVAFLLIGVLLFVASAFMGNPISAIKANIAIKKYVRDNYRDLDLEVGKVSYNFKDGSYIAMAKSRTSVDTHFSVHYRSGKVEWDDYESYVLGMFNTLQRLSREYSSIARELISKELGFENNSTTVMYEKSEYENSKDVLELDMPFDSSLPLNAEVILQINLDDHSIENIANTFTDVHRVFMENGYNFTTYGLNVENDDILVMVTGVTPEDIESHEFVDLLKKAKEDGGHGRIGVWIKE